LLPCTTVNYEKVFQVTGVFQFISKNSICKSNCPSARCGYATGNGNTANM